MKLALRDIFKRLNWLSRFSKNWFNLCFLKKVNNPFTIKTNRGRVRTYYTDKIERSKDELY